MAARQGCFLLTRNPPSMLATPGSSHTLTADPPMHQHRHQPIDTCSCRSPRSPHSCSCCCGSDDPHGAHPQHRRYQPQPSTCHPAAAGPSQGPPPLADPLLVAAKDLEGKDLLLRHLLWPSAAADPLPRGQAAAGPQQTPPALPACPMLLPLPQLLLQGHGHKQGSPSLYGAGTPEEGGPRPVHQALPPVRPQESHMVRLADPNHPAASPRHSTRC